ncbi:MAG TPA: glycosyltransferase family 4 protein [Gammaproteobacteria bacterium]|nr:glycosyltransferase family 4 protein [Gammaproteobacteria bacterium]
MRILWIKIGGLWPCNTGGRLRSFHLLRELSKQHTVTLLTSSDDVEQERALRAQLPQCREIICIPHRMPKWRSLRFALALVGSWLSALPVDMRRSRIARLRAEAARRLAVGDIDLCVADFLAAMPNAPAAPGVPLLLFEHNVEHMIWKRLAEVESRPWRRALLELEWRKLRSYEAMACRRATLTVTVSPVDQARLTKLAAAARIQAVPTGVDTEYFTPNDATEIPGSIVYVGSMDWRPNEDAVLHFIREILPRVREAVPEAHFTVVGKNPSDTLRSAAQRSGVALTGTVDDVRPHLRQAAVCVVPLRIGGGTRLKIFEALAMGKALVSTPIGAEGLPLVHGRHFLCAEAPSAFANAVITLLRDPARRRALGHAGRELVEHRYAWAQVATEFEHLCRQACEMQHGAPRHARGHVTAQANAHAQAATLPPQLQQRR